MNHLNLVFLSSMAIYNYIALSVLGIYSFVILAFTYGWFKLKTLQDNKLKNHIPVSIIIACRNEENNIPLIIDSLLNQTYPKNKTEIIFVDDHSEDKTIEIIEKFADKYKLIKLFKLPQGKKGKKDALFYGIKKSNSEISVTTDADCTMHKDWLKTLLCYYLEYKPSILAGPVAFSDEQNLFQKFQSLEFLSLVGSGAGAIGIHHPIMNNGANLLFEKSIFFDSDLQNNYASGDDIFLMLHTKKRSTKAIHFIKSKDAIVYTKGTKSIKEFLNQRIRWTSKSKAYRDLDVVFTALTVSLSNLILALSFISSFYHFHTFQQFITLFCIKSIFDLILLIPVTHFFHRTRLLWLFFPLQLIYPFYIVFTVFLGLLGNFQWKNRSFKEKR